MFWFLHYVIFDWVITQNKSTTGDGRWNKYFPPPPVPRFQSWGTWQNGPEKTYFSENVLPKEHSRATSTLKSRGGGGGNIYSTYGPLCCRLLACSACYARMHVTRLCSKACVWNGKKLCNFIVVNSSVVEKITYFLLFLLGAEPGEAKKYVNS